MFWIFCSCSFISSWNQTHPERPSHYTDYLGKRLNGCKESMTMDDIPKFETLNDISIAVYRMKNDGQMVFPL